MDLQTQVPNYLVSANFTQLIGQCHICNLKQTQVVQVSTYYDAMNVCKFCIEQFEVYLQYKSNLQYESGLFLSSEDCEVCAKSHVDVIQVSSSHSDDLMTVCTSCLKVFQKFQDIAIQSSKIQLRSLGEFCRYISLSDGILCRGYIENPDFFESTYTIKVRNSCIEIYNDFDQSQVIHFKDIYEAVDAESKYPIDSLVYIQVYKFLESEYLKYQKDPVNYVSLRHDFNDTKLLYWGKVSASKLMQFVSESDI